jgi:hypothetical protein
MPLPLFSIQVSSQLQSKGAAPKIVSSRYTCPTRRHHEGIRNVASADVYYGRREAILKRSEDQKRVTLEERFRHNRSRSKEITWGDLSSKPQR